VSFPIRIAVALGLVLALAAPAVHAAVSAKVPNTPKYAGGLKIYRQFCGQCHSLKEAKAVGFGSAKKNGNGELGGPSFNPLRIPAQLSVLAVTGTWDGHQKVVTRMTWKQIYQVADFIAAATRDHPHLAKLPSDEYVPPPK
jgi:mono/diheme cytochrome c family protein